MALDPPTGCSFSTLKPPKVKLEAIRAQLSNVKSTLSSEWGAIRKVRVAPRIPPNGYLSRQSLAYLHAGTRYVKEVSEIWKLGVTTLRSSSTSYEVVPGALFFRRGFPASYSTSGDSRSDFRQDAAELPVPISYRKTCPRY